MALKIGEKAPPFKLRAHDKTVVSLSDFKGKNVVILFIPAAFTSVCTREFCMLRDGIKAYEALNAQIIGISVDSLFTLNKWREEEGFNFPLLSDFNRKVCKKYDAYYKEFVFEMKDVAKRSAFVVDKAGIIRYVEVLDDAGQLPNFEAIQQTLAQC